MRLKRMWDEMEKLEKKVIKKYSKNYHKKEVLIESSIRNTLTIMLVERVLNNKGLTTNDDLDKTRLEVLREIIKI